MQLGDNFRGDSFDEYSTYSVSLSEDGNTVAIGSAHYYHDNWYNDNTGSMRIFVVE